MTWKRSIPGTGRKKKDTHCKVCHQEKVGRHAHCGTCGVLLRSGAVHAPECAILKLKPGQFCKVCRRLLAPGARCPEHGGPSPEAVAAATQFQLEHSYLCEHWMPREDCEDCR